MGSYLILVFISTVLVTAVLGQGVHLELRNKVIPNNSFVNYFDIGTGSSTLRCMTQRVDCCHEDNATTADWFTPSGEVADTHFIRSWTGLGDTKGDVNIHRLSATIVTSVQEGLYHCNIPAPNGDISTLYVGIYTGDNDGRPTISGITYCQLSPEMFTLTCTSTGGPATTVTWKLNGSKITYDTNHVLTQTVVNTTTAEYNNTLTVTGREPGNYKCTVSNSIRGSATSQMLVVKSTGNNQCIVSRRSTSISLSSDAITMATTMLYIDATTTPASTQDSHLPVAVAVAAVGILLCIVLIIIAVLILVLVYKRKRPQVKKDEHSLRQIDDTRSSINQHLTNPSTGQTLASQPVDIDIKNSHYSGGVNTTLPGSPIYFVLENRDPLYSAITDSTTPRVDPLYSVVTEGTTPSVDPLYSVVTEGTTPRVDPLYSVVTEGTTPSIDPLYSVVTEPPIPTKSIGPPNSHSESNQTVRKEGKTTQKKDVSFTKQEESKQESESKAEDEPKTSPGPGDVYAVVDKPKKVKHSAQSESRADPVTMETFEPAETNAVYAAVQKGVKKKDSPPPLPAPYQDEL